MSLFKHKNHEDAPAADVDDGAAEAPASAPDPPSQSSVQVEEISDEGTLIVRASLPGMDPEKNIDVTVDGRRLNVVAHHREESETTEDGTRLREVRYGYF